MTLTSRFLNPQEHETGFTSLKNLHHLQDKISPLAACMQATLGTVLGLGNFNTLFFKSGYHDNVRFRSISNELGQLKQELESHLIIIESLKDRSQGTFELVRSTSLSPRGMQRLTSPVVSKSESKKQTDIHGHQ